MFVVRAIPAPVVMVVRSLPSNDIMPPMPRSPFDPAKILRPDPPPERPARRDRQYAHVGAAEHLTVGELAGLIKRTLEERIASPLRVIGQVGNLSRRNHWYFSLKDDDAVVSCVAWASSTRRFGFVPEEGDEVVATGHVSHYPPQGRTQFYVSGLEPVGAGAMQLRFQAMCTELRGLGYFDPDRKRPLPALPGRVAVVTSAGGAAVHDVTATAKQRCPAVGLLVVDVRVQGEGAAEDVARAIRWIDRHRERLGVDAILVTRGGGSQEDLWTFNERAVADAAFACGTPLVAAIGHESDTTVIELVADHRAATPTQAAMALVPDADDLRRQADHLRQRLHLLVHRRVEHGRQVLHGLARHEAFRDPAARLQRERRRLRGIERTLAHASRSRLAHARSRVERNAARLAALQGARLVERRHERVAVLAHRLTAALEARVRDAGRRLDARARELSAIDPRRVLHRGFTYTTTGDGTLVRSVRDVGPGAALVTHVADGAIDSVAGKRRPAGRRAAKGEGRGDQMDLFGSPE
jgi:exodeoxyribonuclease VII large subunit